jgi:hypothetical protein
VVCYQDEGCENEELGDKVPLLWRGEWRTRDVVLAGRVDG